MRSVNPPPWRHSLALSNIDTDRAVNWAAEHEAHFHDVVVSTSVTALNEEPSNDAREQGCSDLRSRRRNRWRCGTRLCARGGQVVSIWPASGGCGSCRQGRSEERRVGQEVSA